MFERLPHRRECLHNVSMSNVLVRDLSEQTHSELTRRAQQRGQSLQQYLTDELTRLAAQPTLDDVLHRIETHQGGTVGFGQAATDLAEGRGQ